MQKINKIKTPAYHIVSDYYFRAFIRDSFGKFIFNVADSNKRWSDHPLF